MDVKEAVGLAKQYVRELFADERIVNLGLEEVAFEDKGKAWQITIGFSRPWDAADAPVSIVGVIIPTKRSYKVVKISDLDGRIVSVRDRTLLATPA